MCLATGATLFGATPGPDACKGKTKAGVNLANGLVPDPDNIHQFYQCAHGHVTGTPRPCPNDSNEGHKNEQLIFDVENQACVAGLDVSCPEKDGEFPYTDPKTHQIDEHKFIQCNGGRGAVMTCGPELIFLSKCGACGYDDQKDLPCPTKQPTEPPKTDAPRTDAPKTDAPVGTTKAAECQGKEIKADPEDKSKFYQCKDGKNVHLSCPEGTSFDPAVNSCA